MIMSEYPQFASLPILSGPYSRRRSLVRFRAPVRQFALITATIMAAGALIALIFLTAFP
jgi:hypothetical protein